MAKKRLALLSEEQKDRLRHLEHDGYVSADPDQDPALLKEVYTALQKRAQGFNYSTEAGKGKNFWDHLESQDDRKTSSPFVRYALQPSVINMACGYLGEVPYLSNIAVFLSHGTENDTWQESQLWHCDYDDRKMIRFFTYCTDVNDEKDGAFTFIPQQYSRSVRNTFFPDRISDQEMERQGYAKHAKSLRGPAGTCFYLDTRACYHLGSRVAMGHTRIALFITYVTFAGLQHFDNNIQIVHSPTESEQLVLQH
jgi:hypothetical protein